ncbi:MAG: hypothetical protein K2Y27_14450 [Xanthobacteraceae bacterium]|nr:hypothetical protein [Xanthobacteraceae bacterium]
MHHQLVSTSATRSDIPADRLVISSVIVAYVAAPDPQLTLGDLTATAFQLLKDKGYKRDGIETAFKQLANSYFAPDQLELSAATQADIPDDISVISSIVVAYMTAPDPRLTLGGLTEAAFQLLKDQGYKQGGISIAFKRLASSYSTPASITARRSV